MNPINAEACLNVVKSTFAEHSFLKVMVAMFGCTWSYMYGSGAAILPVLLLIILDSLTGVMKAIKAKELSSNWYKLVFAKFLVCLILVAVAGIFDQEVSSFLPKLENQGYALITIKFFIVTTECISIIENIGAMGFPVPTKFLKYLKDFDSDTGAKRK